MYWVARGRGASCRGRGCHTWCQTGPGGSGGPSVQQSSWYPYSESCRYRSASLRARPASTSKLGERRRSLRHQVPTVRQSCAHEMAHEVCPALPAYVGPYVPRVLSALRKLTPCGPPCTAPQTKPKLTHQQYTRRDRQDQRRTHRDGSRRKDVCALIVRRTHIASRGAGAVRCSMHAARRAPARQRQ